MRPNGTEGKAEGKEPKVGKTGELFAENVTYFRKREGLTMRELAQRLTDSGRPMSHTVISQIENKQRRVDIDELALLADALRVSIGALLTPRSESPEDEIGSTPNEHDSAAEVVKRVYGLPDAFPDWVEDAIEEAIEPKWQYRLEGANMATKETFENIMRIMDQLQRGS